MVIRYLALLIVSFSYSNAFSQFKDISRPEAPDRFIAYISPISTESDLNDILHRLEEAGFKIALKDFNFTSEGKLKSFYAKIVSDCAEPEYQYEGITDFSADDQYPLAAMVIGQDCSSGVFTTTYDNVQMMYNIFFPDKNPEHIFYAWQGDFDNVRDVVLDGSH